MFVVGLEYHRTELLDFVGSKQGQSGILWGPVQSSCVILTTGGKHGKTSGYGDIRNYDGSWLYTGQGSKGDQNPKKHANSILINEDRTILLFSTRELTFREAKERGSRSKRYKFEGLFLVASWDLFTPGSGKRSKDALIRFLLVPAENIFESSHETISDNSHEDSNHANADLLRLRGRLNENREKPQKGKVTVKDYQKRSQAVKDYALARAAGVCENCLNKAPFLTGVGVPFLEVHHIFRLADDGPDAPENVASVCPNCHRNAHFGMYCEILNKELALRIKEKETSLMNEMKSVVN